MKPPKKTDPEFHADILGSRRDSSVLFNQVQQLTVELKSYDRVALQLGLAHANKWIKPPFAFIASRSFLRTIGIYIRDGYNMYPDDYDNDDRNVFTRKIPERWNLMNPPFDETSDGKTLQDHIVLWLHLSKAKRTDYALFIPLRHGSSIYVNAQTFPYWLLRTLSGVFESDLSPIFNTLRQIVFAGCFLGLEVLMYGLKTTTGKFHI